MKHWLTAILVVLMCWTLVGCGGDSGKTTTSGAWWWHTCNPRYQRYGISGSRNCLNED
jgi:hypothetical protein